MKGRHDWDHLPILSDGRGKEEGGELRKKVWESLWSSIPSWGRGQSEAATVQIRTAKMDDLKKQNKNQSSWLDTHHGNTVCTWHGAAHLSDHRHASLVFPQHWRNSILTHWPGIVEAGGGQLLLTTVRLLSFCRTVWVIENTRQLNEYSKGIASHIFLILIPWTDRVEKNIHHLFLSAHFSLSKGQRSASSSQFPGAVGGECLQCPCLDVFVFTRYWVIPRSPVKSGVRASSLPPLPVHGILWGQAWRWFNTL